MIPRYQPMLASPWRAPFSDERWLFEPKWDGVRVMLTFDGEGVTLRTRRGNDVTTRYPELTSLRFEDVVVLDGEIVVLDAGVPSFERLQQRSGRYDAVAAATHPVSCIVFDVLHLARRPLIGDPIEQRIDVLARLDLHDPFTASQPVLGSGLDLWEAVLEHDLEGMVAKRLGSAYRPGIRSEDWRKIHHVHTVRAVVGGFTRGEAGRAGSFGALLVGMWEGDSLRWGGSVGSGFSESALSAIRATLEELRRDTSPFHPDPGLPEDAIWVEPALVVAVGYRNWTGAGRLRHPRFRGFTDDPVEAVTWETEGVR